MNTNMITIPLEFDGFANGDEVISPKFAAAINFAMEYTILDMKVCWIKVADGSGRYWQVYRNSDGTIQCLMVTRHSNAGDVPARFVSKPLSEQVVNETIASVESVMPVDGDVVYAVVFEHNDIAGIDLYKHIAKSGGQS